MIASRQDEIQRRPALSVLGRIKLEVVAQMHKIALVSILATAVQLTACASAPESTPLASNSSDGDHETVLLVSLADGSVVKQSISGSADICFKENSKSATTCFTEGEPIVDPKTQQVIAYRMVEDKIELLPDT